MSMRTVVVALACLSFGLSGFVDSGNVRQDEELEQADQLKQDARKQFMRGKLTSNQQIVEGLSLKNFDLVSSGAQGVVGLVKGQHWFVLDTPEYRDHSRDMEMAATRLQQAAEAKNIEAAALRYFDLTLSCIDCHEYLETLGQ